MKKLTTEEFIAKAQHIHGNTYNYSKVVYHNMDSKICIICPIHGEFWQTPYKHLNSKGCPMCLGHYRNNEDFVRSMRLIHGNKYDYSKVVYVNAKEKVCIICPIHGEFWQTPDSHKQGCGCPQCATHYKNNLLSKNTDQFIQEANVLHNYLYDYSKTNYVNAYTKIKIICPTHGVFEQEPRTHLRGYGCPCCNQSKLELDIEALLKDENITYEKQKTFEWLKSSKSLRIDFYLPQYNIAIECQGKQHFQAVKHFGGEKNFEKQQLRDKRKQQLCEEHGIKLLYYSEQKWIEEIFTDKMLLLNCIKNYGN